MRSEQLVKTLHPFVKALQIGSQLTHIQRDVMQLDRADNHCDPILPLAMSRLFSQFSRTGRLSISIASGLPVHHGRQYAGSITEALTDVCITTIVIHAESDEGRYVGNRIFVA
jgi:hypothetical protein